jgi:hypothetical protein
MPRIRAKLLATGSGLVVSPGNAKEQYHDGAETFEASLREIGDET